MPQTTVYDYILFRGSDIKDIRVVNNVAIPNDPAIMQMHLPTPNNFQQNFPSQQSGTPVMGQFGLPFAQMQGGNMSQAIGNMPSQQQAQSPIHQGNNNHNNVAPGSGHKNKKSSELSNNQNLVSEKSTENTLTSVKAVPAVRKQSNKIQGVHRKICVSQFPLLLLSSLA
jgi:protein LSM14